MSANLVQKPDLSQATAQTVVIGLRCRNLSGFLFMWREISSFIRATKNADGCIQAIPAICSPFEILLVSYWQSPKEIGIYLAGTDHKRWTDYIYANPTSLALFNETYGAPVRANFINEARGYARTIGEKQT